MDRASARLLPATMSGPDLHAHTPDNTGAEQMDCLICASPAQDICHVAPCGHHLGCWGCVRHGLDTLANCWLCRQPAIALVQESTGKMISVDADYTLFHQYVGYSDTFRQEEIPVDWPSRTLLPQEAHMMRRMYIYHHHLFSHHVGSNATSGYREVIPGRFRNNVEMQGRARAFLRRELRVFSYIARNDGRPRFSPLPWGREVDTDHGRLPGDEVEIIQEVEGNVRYFIHILKSIDLKDSTGAAERAAESQLQPALCQMEDSQTAVRLFLHELRAFLRSPYTSLKDWDANTHYDTPGRGAASLPRLYDGVAASRRTRISHRSSARSQQPDRVHPASAVSDGGFHGHSLPAAQRGESSTADRTASRSSSPNPSESSTGSDGSELLDEPFHRSLPAGGWQVYLDIETSWRLFLGNPTTTSSGSQPTDAFDPMPGRNYRPVRSTYGGWSLTPRRSGSASTPNSANGSSNTAQSTFGGSPPRQRETFTFPGDIWPSRSDNYPPGEGAPQTSNMLPSDMSDWRYYPEERDQGFEETPLLTRARRNATSTVMRTWRGMDF